MTKHIFVTGGVVSSLGKGLTSAAMGMLIEGRGLKIAMQKLDPYINVDPGTMNPHEHGEVFVTEDGAETDLDLGHYERFTNAVIRKSSNVTTGRVYQSVIDQERRGDFLGGTIQVIPHITNEIKRCMMAFDSPEVDVVIHEIGGTVGDIESLPFLEAIRQFGRELGPQNAVFVHLTLLPFLRASGELKSKPTQHSVGKLREIGIFPDMLVCRTEVSMSQGIRDKISLFCNVPKEAVIEEKDVDFSIYELPLMLHRQGVDTQILKKLGLPTDAEPDLCSWAAMLERVRHPGSSVSIAVVGKYITLQDAYKSLYEALQHAGIDNDARVVVHKVSSEAIEKDGPERHLLGVDGVLVPGGFGDRGIEGKITAVKYARESKVPFFGICLGMQCAVIEFARNVAGMQGAHSTEFSPDTKFPVVSLLSEQRTVKDKGGTMRRGGFPCALSQGSKAAAAYGAAEVSERHRHRFELNTDFRRDLEAAGLSVTGVFAQKDLVEIVELPGHPWFVGVQFHPEFKSKPVKAHPLFRDFIAAAGRFAEAKRAALSKAGEAADAADGKPGRRKGRRKTDR